MDDVAIKLLTAEMMFELAMDDEFVAEWPERLELAKRAGTIHNEAVAMAFGATYGE